MHSLGKEINKITYLHFLFKYPPCPSPEKSIISRFSWKLHGLRKKNKAIFFPVYGIVNKKRNLYKWQRERGYGNFQNYDRQSQTKRIKWTFSMAIRIGQLTWNQRKVVWYGLAVFLKALKRVRLQKENIANANTLNYLLSPTTYKSKRDFQNFRNLEVN